MVLALVVVFYFPTSLAYAGSQYAYPKEVEFQTFCTKKVEKIVMDSMILDTHGNRWIGGGKLKADFFKWSMRPEICIVKIVYTDFYSAMVFYGIVNME